MPLWNPLMKFDLKVKLSQQTNNHRHTQTLDINSSAKKQKKEIQKKLILLFVSQIAPSLSPSHVSADHLLCCLLFSYRPLPASLFHSWILTVNLFKWKMGKFCRMTINFVAFARFIVFALKMVGEGEGNLETISCFEEMSRKEVWEGLGTL